MRDRRTLFFLPVLLLASAFLLQFHAPDPVCVSVPFSGTVRNAEKKNPDALLRRNPFLPIQLIMKNSRSSELSCGTGKTRTFSTLPERVFAALFSLLTEPVRNGTGHIFLKRLKISFPIRAGPFSPLL